MGDCSVEQAVMSDLTDGSLSSACTTGGFSLHPAKQACPVCGGHHPGEQSAVPSL